MKKSKFTEAQIVFALRQAENGVKIEEVCRKLGITETTFHNWKKKYAGLGVGELKKLKDLQEENQRLKQIVADLSLDKLMLQDVLKKNACLRQLKLSAQFLIDQYKISKRKAAANIGFYASWA